MNELVNNLVNIYQMRILNQNYNSFINNERIRFFLMFLYSKISVELKKIEDAIDFIVKWEIK